jgi:hypothetical protein
MSDQSTINNVISDITAMVRRIEHEHHHDAVLTHAQIALLDARGWLQLHQAERLHLQEQQEIEQASFDHR